MITNNRHIFTALSAILLLGAAVMPAHANVGNLEIQPTQNYVLPAQSLIVLDHEMSAQDYELWVQNKISAAQAKSIARRQVKGGEVVDISRNGGTYRVRVIAKNGRVVDVFIDANTGRVKR